jgi:RepB DNA-primase from phage plasmid
MPFPEGETRAGGRGQDMLGAFASVGAARFDLTLTDAAGVKIAFRPGLTLDRLRPALPGILQAAAERRHNVIVRPRPAQAALIQLDDLDATGVDRVKPAAFLVLRTSPGSYQAWVAVSDADAEFTRRLRKGTGADPNASGATRVSGSLNFKAKYAPAFPLVETVHVHPGRVVTRDMLEALGVVALPEKAEPSSPRTRVSPRLSNARRWPDYRRCVENAPLARDGQHPDISRADFTWCLIAIDWGWGVEETAARLMQESRKAQENGEAYAQRTARNAAAAVERRQGRGR